MPFRMADYYLRIYRRYPNKQIHQFVIYLDKTSSEKVYQTTFTTAKMRHEFSAIRLWEEPPEIFLRTPGLLPFAVLSATQNKASTLQLVAAAVDKIGERRTQSNISAAAAILAGLVLEEEVIERLFRRDIMRESVIYKSIKTEGIEEGVRLVAVNLLKENMPIEMVAKVTGLTIEQVQSLVTTDVEQSE
ncbi:Rpn family recombination-promoting nuclease/putative transposase [Nostoc sp. FACHB-145]|nr:Rpn family recombination-promoting nuclease/putative transposase [Nostoc sp. FACHB-145]MBD2468831.1 Rpn family recombination-promoting nuclease/putative transposase [Nostoc sp. FACHB-145]